MATLANYNRIVIKIGSSLLIDEETGNVNQAWLETVAADIAKYIKTDKHILLVSSGAIALGRKRLGIKSGTLTLAQKQACAAAGQSLLTQTYETVLAPFNIVTAQALLTINDTENRRRWINAKETLTTLLSLGAVPIVNENDTVATDEIRYGDNDRLAARVAQMVGADLLILLSDVDGLYDKDPSLNPDAKHMARIDTITPQIMAMGGRANQQRGTGSGGMATKLQAAQISTQAGCALVITKGSVPNPISALDAKNPKASWFTASTNTVAARKLWIASSLKPKGSLVVDHGAAHALNSGKSLLAAGLVSVEGEFDKGDAVIIKNTEHAEIGRGLTGYSAVDAALIIGLNSKDISRKLGYDSGMPLIHRDNMALKKNAYESL